MEGREVTLWSFGLSECNRVNRKSQKLFPLLKKKGDEPCVGTLLGEKTLSFTYLLSFLRGIYSQRKEFAPLGANSFLEE